MKKLPTLLYFTCLILLGLSIKAQVFNFTVSPSQQCYNGANTGTASITFTAAAATSYSWSTASSNSCSAGYTLAAPNGSIANLAFPCAGNYTVYSYALNGATVLATMAHTVNVAPTPVITASVLSSSSPACSGNASFTLFVGGGISYSVAGPVLPGMAFTPLSSGCVSVTGSNIQGCTAAAVGCYSVAPNPTIAAIGSPTVLCVGSTATLVALGATTYTWFPGLINSGVVAVTPSVSTCYTVVGANAFGCTASAVQCIFVNPAPSISVTGNNATCASSGATTLTAAGGLTYSWSIGATGSQIFVSPNSSTCYSVIGSNANGCVGMAVHCLTVFPAPIITISGNSTVCLGSSVNFTASGAGSYTWNTIPLVTTNTLTAIPLVSTNYIVSGTGTNGCIGSANVLVNPSSSCADVWPGDANNDGVVGNTDVFEIGFAFNNTGAARSFTSNAYSSQHATAWSGTVSSGKNKSHADCNGDGSINNADTAAIHGNFSLTHPFKISENTVANADVSLIVPNTVYTGQWNKADIMLGDVSAPLNQLYGVAFDVNIDQSMLDNNAAYILYTPSFLNAGNQNVQFRKNDVGNGKIYAASVRVDGVNVNGNGKIGELWFKVSSSATANSVLHLSVSNSVKVGNNGISSVLSSGSSSATVSTNAVKLNELNLLDRSVSFYPNPANNQITLRSDLGSSVTYSVIDLLGREVTKGEFSKNKTILVSDFENGTYFIRFTSGTQSSCKKLVVSR